MERDELFSKIDGGIGGIEAKQIKLRIDETIDAAKRCQFIGRNGVLENYLDLSGWYDQVVMKPDLERARYEPLDPKIAKAHEVFHHIWPFVDGEVMSALSENCSCRLR